MTDASRDADLVAYLLPIAKCFRAVMESIKSDWNRIEEDGIAEGQTAGAFANLRMFPSNCCDKTTMLMVRYLNEQGLTNARSVAGDPPTGFGPRHEWIEVGRVIVDITADQFEEVHPLYAKVIVSADPNYFKCLNRREVHRYTPGWSEWIEYDSPHRRFIEWLYEIVSQRINACIGGDQQPL